MPREARRWGLAVAVFGLLERSALWASYQPIAYGDTAPYLRLANDLLTRGLGGYDGTRVPGYPVFMLLLGMDGDRIWLAQMALGWGISLLLFWMGWRTTGSVRLGALLAAVYDLTPGLLFFEANLISETLATFAVVGTLALFIAFCLSPNERGKLFLAFAIGLGAGIAGLVRPLFYVLAVWLLPFVVLEKGPSDERGALGLRESLTALKRQWRSRLARAAAFATPALALLGGWVWWVYGNYGMLSPDTKGGFYLVQHTGSFFEFLPEEDALIRDTYLRFREAQIAERGDQTNAIYAAIPELTRVTGMSVFDLSRELQRLSLRLIGQHPLLYLRSVAVGWVDFWRAPVYWRPDLLHVPLSVGLLDAIGRIGRLVSVATNAAFLLLTATAIMRPKARRLLGVDSIVVACGGLVLLSSVAQSLVEHGDNPRFLVPLQMIVFYVVVRAAHGWRAVRSEVRQ
jgi:hypothetical protein